MAIYHFHAGFVSRSSGRSAVQTAAYNTGTKLKETRRNLIADYRNRAYDVLFYGTFAPSHARKLMRTLEVWDNVETYEDEYALLRYRTEEAQEKYKNSAQVAQTIVVALPKELRLEVWQELVTEFAIERFVSRGLVVTVAIHKDEGNPHAHFLISRRSVTEDGKWSWTKDREIVSKSSLVESRKLWADKTNAYLAREGLDVRIDHRSYAELGLAFEPSQHKGWYADALGKQGLSSRIAEENRESQNRNKEYLGLHPEEILKELTLKQATFSTLDLSRLIQKRVPDDAVLASYIFEASLSKAIIVGSGLDGQTRYTSQDYLHLETQALELTRSLMQGKASLPIDKLLQEEWLQTSYGYLNSEQKSALRALCDNQQFSVLVGRAGTGKTATLKPVIALHLQAGYKALGISLAAKAAENLSLETDCPAETLAFYLDKWDRLEQANQALWSLHSSEEQRAIEKELSSLAPYALSPEHLIILDEAGMVGTRQWAALLGHLKKAGAKFIAVGDNHQFKAIEAGDFFRKLIEEAVLQNKLSLLSTIVRQKEAWMREASLDLAELRTYEALATYEKQGAIQRLEGADFNTIAKAYVEQRISNPQETGLLLASTRAQCQDLNRAVREQLKERELLSKREVNIQGKSFAVNDEIIFLQNDRQKVIACSDAKTKRMKAFLVKNGTRAKILDIQPDSDPIDGDLYYQIIAQIDSDTLVQFCSGVYADFDHSYALTLHKSQGQTVDWSLIYASQYMDAYASYVALTRHRKQTILFYDGKTFPSFKGLQKSLSRLSPKDLAIDYSIKPSHQAAWETVQDYVLLSSDLIATIREKNWSAYHSIKKEREEVGHQILSAWEEHRSYVQQAGLSQEALEIACGLKVRPLSTVEQQAYQLVQEYAQKAMEARRLWREIRCTHPGNQCYQHSQYAAFTEVREARNQLAKAIVSNRPLYKEFISQLGRDLGIGWQTLVNQANQQPFKREPDYPYSHPTNKSKSSQESSDSNFKDNAKTPHRQANASSFQKERAAEKPAYRTSAPFVKIDPEQVKQALNERIESLALTLLGEPKRRSGREYKYGRKGSVSIHIAGSRQGLYSNFEIGSHGGGLKLIQDTLDLDYKQAYQWAVDWLGFNQETTRPQPVRKEAGSPIQKQDWTPIFPVPRVADNNQQFKDCLAYQLETQGRKEIARYAYRDAEGHLLGYTVRLENDEGKMVLPLTYCQSAKSNYRQWRWQGFGEDRPLYGLEKLKAYPYKQVLIVEGEKTAECAQERFPDFVVLTWLGGTGAVSKADWSPLKGREITLWPDNDAPGIQAVHKIVECLAKINPEQALKPHVITLPLNTPPKWDLADPLPQDWEMTLRDILEIGNPWYETELSQMTRRTLLKYHLEKPAEVSDKDFQNRVEMLYSRMISWSKAFNYWISVEDRLKLREKAAIVEGIRDKAQQEYCFLATPAEALMRSEDIALIAANLLEETGQNGFSKALLKQAANMHDQQFQHQLPELLKEYQAQYPQRSSQEIEILANQHMQCWNMTSKTLTKELQEQVIHWATTFKDNLKDATWGIKCYLKAEALSPNRDNATALIKLLERHYIGRNIGEKSEAVTLSHSFRTAAECIPHVSLDRKNLSLSLNQPSRNQKGLEL